MEKLHKIQFKNMKTVHYETDGCGRDTYITKTNGGFFKNEKIDIGNIAYQLQESNI